MAHRPGACRWAAIGSADHQARRTRDLCGLEGAVERGCVADGSEAVRKVESVRWTAAVAVPGRFVANAGVALAGRVLLAACGSPSPSGDGNEAPADAATNMLLMERLMSVVEFHCSHSLKSAIFFRYP
jgi:hypothetical protein